MIDSCKWCGWDHLGTLANSSTMRGDKFNVVTNTYTFYCPIRNDFYTESESHRDYLGDAKSGPDGMQGRRIGP